MKVREDSETHSAQSEAEGAELLSPLVLGKSTRRVTQETLQGIVIGELVAMTNNARTPLVTFAGSGDSKAVRGALRGRLAWGPHRPACRPGVRRDGARRSLSSSGCCGKATAGRSRQQPGQVEVDADGQRLVVTAKEQLVLGRVYNAEQTPPFGFPAGAVISGIKSQTHKGAGYNEISADDTAGKERSPSTASTT